MEITLKGQSDGKSFDQGSVRFVGTATTVIQYGGITILTDPNFLHAGEQIHIGYGIDQHAPDESGAGNRATPRPRFMHIVAYA